MFKFFEKYVKGTIKYFCLGKELIENNLRGFTLRQGLMEFTVEEMSDPLKYVDYICLDILHIHVI